MQVREIIRGTLSAQTQKLICIVAPRGRQSVSPVLMFRRIRCHDKVISVQMPARGVFIRRCFPKVAGEVPVF